VRRRQRTEHEPDAVRTIACSAADVIPTITIRSTGVAPRELTVAVGDRVTFINNDSQPHDPAGGPDPANPDCREIDAVGFLVPGQSRQTSPLPVARTCDFHDHSNHDPIFNGRIIIR
jgi:plastocyanin